jgi:hypothetical protein
MFDDDQNCGHESAAIVKSSKNVAKSSWYLACERCNVVTNMKSSHDVYSIHFF